MGAIPRFVLNAEVGRLSGRHAPLRASIALQARRCALEPTHGRRPLARGIILSLPAATGRKMHFTGTTVLRVRDGKILEEIGLDDGVTALTQLGLIKLAA